MQQPLTCALCGDPIEPGQAWMTRERDGNAAHAGCVYRDEPASGHEDRWSPSPESAGA